MLADSARAGQPARSRRSARSATRWASRSRRSPTCSTREAVLLGGYLAPLSEWLRVPIEGELETSRARRDGMRCRVLPARLGGEAAVRGAASSARRRVLADPLAYEARSLAGAAR